jgi:hypothetical protein
MFFPYILENNKLVENSLLEGNKFAYAGLSAEMLPIGVSKVDLKWLYYYEINKMKTYKMQLYSGFMGIGQDSSTKALRPEISWTILDVAKNQSENEKNIDSIESKGKLGNHILFISNLNTAIIPWEESIRVDVEMFRFGFAIDSFRLHRNNAFGPNLFPNKSKVNNENSQDLCNYIKSKLKSNSIKLRAELEFVVNWTGTIDEISISKSNKPEYNDEIISIVSEIKGCQPAKIGKMIANARIYAEIKIN